MWEPTEVTAIACGPQRLSCPCKCPDGPCEHVWDGPMTPAAPFGVVSGESVTCSKCGIQAITHDLWTMP